MKIPENYLPVMPYLILDDATSFLNYAKKVFNATEQMIVLGEDGRSIVHAEIKINDAVIMFAGSSDKWQQKPAGMFIFVEDTNKTYNAGIEQGGTSLLEPAQQEYGYGAGFEDPYGNQWWITQAE